MFERSRGPFGSELWAGRVARPSKKRGERGGRAVSAARRPRAEEVRAGTGPAADRAEPAAAPRAAAPWSFSLALRLGSSLKRFERRPSRIPERDGRGRPQAGWRALGSRQ